MWLAVQRRLAKVDMLEKIGIQCHMTVCFIVKQGKLLIRLLWGRLCSWLGFHRVIFYHRIEWAGISDIAKRV